MRHDIVVFTGSRADFSLLLPLITRLESEHNVTVLASGGHLQKEQGYTINTVKESVHTDVISADIALDNDKDLTRYYLACHKSVRRYSLNAQMHFIYSFR